MKTPHLLASFAVAATASAAEFKDPAEVAREWNEKTAPSASPAWSDDLSLRGISGMPEPFMSARRHRLLQAPGNKPASPFQIPPWSKSRPRNRPEEAPGDRDNPTGKMPPGAKEWKYGGQTYWLLPLIPSRDS